MSWSNYRGAKRFERNLRLDQDARIRHMMRVEMTSDERRTEARMSDISSDIKLKRLERPGSCKTQDRRTSGASMSDRREYFQQYRAANREKLRAYARAYRAKNREKLDARAKEWQKKNPERTAETQRRYRAKKKEQA